MNNTSYYWIEVRSKQKQAPHPAYMALLAALSKALFLVLFVPK